MPSNQKLFVPFSEQLLAAAGSPLGELVPYQRGYECVRLLDGTLELRMLAEASGATPLKTKELIGQAA